MRTNKTATVSSSIEVSLDYVIAKHIHSSLITIHALAFPPCPSWLNLIPRRGQLGADAGRRLETASSLVDDRQLLGFAVAEQFGLERYFLGSHRLSRDHVGEVPLGTAGLEVHAHAIRGRLRVCDDIVL